MDTNSLLIEKISGPDPLLISRMGTGECHVCLTDNLSSGHVKFIASVNMGISPPTDGTLDYFRRRYKLALQSTDILLEYNTDWFHIEKTYSDKYLPLNSIRIPVQAMDDALQWITSPNTWLRALDHKKILIVSPFSASIEKQYQKGFDVLFGKNHHLPIFQSLQIIQAPLTQALPDYAPKMAWASHLALLQNQVDEKLSLKMEQKSQDDLETELQKNENENEMIQKFDFDFDFDFDIALLGCGSYGLPLAQYIKSKGKKAIYLGGCLQLMFGIRGRRWDTMLEDWNQQNIICLNEWVRPSKEETPKIATRIENACYW